ncbi:DeoR/GlpR family DNA-binding transcription regulator [Paenibacillus pinihumi]|uniref:DeoR/GlpR family DNA-binding transcription regulator n=1 Tax=Paenibacillus pinihumi TaxID=669462 RepID=UPI000409FAA9|nr:DeoR/GlpR family DNA-binding transcription regulator [Paenibacillus pinihumi]
MLREERHQLILERLIQKGKVVATELSQQLQVSEDTIRRDLREMDAAGLLHRVHGGALPKAPAAVRYDDRQLHSIEAKEQLAEKAVSLVRDGQVIIMDGGTTTLRVAERLPRQLSATVVTNCPPIAVALASHPGIEVIMLGGHLFKNSLINIGAATVSALSNIRADLCFIGVYCIHPEIGLSVPFIEEMHVKRQMIASSSEVVAIATADKLGTSSSFIFSPANALSCLVTEPEVSAGTLAPYRELGITVMQ